MSEKQEHFETESEKCKQVVISKPFATAAQVLVLVTAILGGGCAANVPQPSLKEQTRNSKIIKKRIKNIQDGIEKNEKRLKKLREKINEAQANANKKLFCKDLLIERIKMLEEMYEIDPNDKIRNKQMQKQLFENQMQLNRCNQPKRP